MEVRDLTIEEIIEIHDRIIATTGGESGIQSNGNLDFTVEQVKFAEDFIKKAAILMRGIIERHPFIDGNKRTGLRCLETFLRYNYKEVMAEDKDLKEMLLNIAMGNLTLPEIIRWLNENTKTKND